MGSILVLNPLAPSHQGNSQLSLLPNRAIQRWHNERGNNEINRLDKLGNTSHHSHRHIADVVGGPRTRRGWGGNVGSINTDVCFDTCVFQGSSRTVSSWPVLARVIKRADTGGHTQQTLITVNSICR